MPASGTIQISSKSDARRIAKQLMKKDKKFNFAMPFTGPGATSMSIQWSAALNAFFGVEAGLGWRRRYIMNKVEVVDYLWQKRKYINARQREGLQDSRMNEAATM